MQMCVWTTCPESSREVKQIHIATSHHHRSLVKLSTKSFVIVIAPWLPWPSTQSNIPGFSRKCPIFMHPRHGRRRHGQGGTLATTWRCCKVFLWISLLSTVLAGEVFVHYFIETCRQLLGAFLQTPTGAPPLDSHWGLPFLRPLICLPLEKNPAGTHDPRLCL